MACTWPASTARSMPRRISRSPIFACRFLISSSDMILYPTLPSRLTPSSFCASTANSMGSSRKTSLQKPFDDHVDGVFDGDAAAFEDRRAGLRRFCWWRLRVRLCWRCFSRRCREVWARILSPSRRESHWVYCAIFGRFEDFDEVVSSFGLSRPRCLC